MEVAAEEVAEEVGQVVGVIYTGAQTLVHRTTAMLAISPILVPASTAMWSLASTGAWTQRQPISAPTCDPIRPHPPVHL